MRPEDVPENLSNILDKAAGKDHSADGPVMACLAEILAAHELQVRAKVADEIDAFHHHDDRACVEYVLCEASKIARGDQ